MKKIVYAIFALILLSANTLKVAAQSEDNRSVSDFNGIASGGPFDVHIKINGTESLHISAAADVIKEIETTVEDGKLKIKFKNHHYWKNENYGKIDIFITAKSLSSLANAGSGSMKVEEGVVTGENVSMALSGSGEISSAVKCGELHAAISGSGSLNLNGSASETKLSISGSGEMNAKDFKTGSASVTIAGSGSAYFDAEKNISARIVGSGNIIYTGNASVENKTVVGSGSLRKAD